MKYIKWIFLLILIVCLIILGVRLINYNKFKIEDIYDYVWINNGFSYYDGDGKLVVSEDLQIDNHYMLFSDGEVSYCSKITDECTKYSYNYNKGKLTFITTDDFIYNGTYDLKLKDGNLELSAIINENNMVYYFTRFLG